LQLSKHIGKAVWSTADKMLYVLLGGAFVLPQKMIGAKNYGIFVSAQTILTAIYMLSDGLSLQSMVTFGTEGHRRAEAMTISALTHALFIGVCTLVVYAGRGVLADFFAEPGLETALAYFPLVSLGFLLRNYFLKVSQLDIDIRSMFFIDAAWVGTTLLLFALGWVNRTLVTADDMMIISAMSAGASSLTGLALCGRRVRLTRAIDRGRVRQTARFGVAQCAAAATLVLQTQGDVLVLMRFATAASVGNYDVAKKFFRAFEALRDAGSMFVYPAVARLRAQSRMGEMVLMVEKMIGFTLVVVVPVVLLVWLAPVELVFRAIYKSQYTDAPHLFRLLSLAALAIPFVLNLNVLTGLGESRAGFRSTLLSSVVFFLVALVLVPVFDTSGAALAIVASFIALGASATMAVQRRVPFSLVSALGRWRDAFDYGMRFWRKHV
jgi:O-antigen/teichoic acid export membrane protein